MKYRMATQGKDIVTAEDIFDEDTLKSFDEYEDVYREGNIVRWKKPVMDEMGYQQFLLDSGHKSKTMQKSASMSL